MSLEHPVYLDDFARFFDWYCKHMRSLCHGKWTWFHFCKCLRFWNIIEKYPRLWNNRQPASHCSWTRSNLHIIFHWKYFNCGRARVKSCALQFTLSQDVRHVSALPTCHGRQIKIDTRYFNWPRIFHTFSVISELAIENDAVHHVWGERSLSLARANPHSSERIIARADPWNCSLKTKC